MAAVLPHSHWSADGRTGPRADVGTSAELHAVRQDLTFEASDVLSVMAWSGTHFAELSGA